MTAASRQKREETTPLLGSSLKNYLTGSSSDSEEDRITILTSNPPSISDGKSSIHEHAEQQQQPPRPEDILASRLNGASLLTILSGYQRCS